MGLPRFIKADERGSVVAVADVAGNVVATNSYDEYGAPASAATGRFGYTGQAWLPELGLYYYKARLYDPRLGRFMQTDPIGYGDGMNMYAYVGGDPVNFGDPSGLCKDGAGKNVGAPTGSRICGGHGRASVYGGIAGSMSGSTTAGPGGAGGPTFGEAYQAAKDLMGGYGSAAVNATADYFMGSGSLSKVQTAMNVGSVGSFGINVGGANLYLASGLSSLLPVGTPGVSSVAFQPFLNAANNAFQNNGMNSAAGRSVLGWLRGIRIHSMFAASINALGPMYHAEVSYKGGVLVPYGTPGSIRADGVYGPLNKPIFAVELKSGLAYISRGELEAYRRNLPPGTGLYGIVEGR